MYIVRWLMGHPIIATWVLGAIAILLTLGSGYKANNSDVSVEHIEAKKTGLSASDPIKITIVEDNFTKKSDVTNESSTDAEELVVIPASTGADSKVKVEEAPLAVTPDSAKLINDGLNVSSKPADLGQSSAEELLQMAREAYWNNGLDEAAQIYKQLIEMEPNIVEHKGELGNVYWRQGYPKKAAELYSEIAIPMIDEGNSDRVANMVGFIELFYPKKAAEINKRIQLKNNIK